MAYGCRIRTGTTLWGRCLSDTSRICRGDNWREAIKQVQPDVIYALLNWQAVPFAHEVLMATPGIPFVWHFKEGPFICLEKGTWPQLVDLHQYSDGQIFSSPEMRDWFDTVVPGLSLTKPTHVLDGDLPKRDWFDRPRTPLRSSSVTMAKFIPSHRGGRSACIRITWRNWPVMASICIFTGR